MRKELDKQFIFPPPRPYFAPKKRATHLAVPVVIVLLALVVSTLIFI